MPEGDEMFHPKVSIELELWGEFLSPLIHRFWNKI